MKILALDTSCMMGSVAILDGDRIIAEQLLNTKITHSERLIPSIQTVLDAADAKLSDLAAFAVAIGPGSFTGLRIGLGAVKGLAFALSKPVVGVSSLVALAYNLYGSELPIVSVLDARRGEYYVSINRFEKNKLVNILDETVLPPEEVVAHAVALKEKVVFLGDGVYGLEKLIEKKLSKKAVVPPPGILYPRASNIAWLAITRLEKGDSDDLAALVPNYIRRSDAELPKHEARISKFK